MKAEPRVSVIIPVYRIPKDFLKACLESVLGQTLADIEAVAVDDGSPDGCGVFLNAYAEKDARLRVIHQPNRGLSAARNAGQREARGEYILFLDGDDWIESKTCETLLRRAEETEADVVLCETSREYARSSTPMPVPLEDGAIFSGEEIWHIRALCLQPEAYLADVWGKLIRKHLLDEGGLCHDPELRCGIEGLEFCMRLFKAARRVAFCKQPLWHYRYRADSLSQCPDEAQKDLILRGFSRIERQISTEPKLQPLLDARIAVFAATWVVSGIYNPDRREQLSDRNRRCADFGNEVLIARTMASPAVSTLGWKRRMVLFFLRHHWVIPLWMMGWLRTNSKKWK